MKFACRSGLFASVGSSVFFSQASSLADGFREDGDSAEAIAGAFVERESLITISNAMRKRSQGQEIAATLFSQSGLPNKKAGLHETDRPFEREAVYFSPLFLFSISR